VHADAASSAGCFVRRVGYLGRLAMHTDQTSSAESPHAG
jgi:hypothetical protein